MSGAITLTEVTRDNWRESLALAVYPEQQRFVADYTPIAAIVLAKAYVGVGGRRWTPLLIRSQGGAVGLVAISAPAVEPVEECWLYHFFIDRRHQGKGLGRAALETLLDDLRVRYPACATVFLTVHPENLRAQRLYESAGFLRTGQERDGEPVYVLTLDRVPDETRSGRPA